MIQMIRSTEGIRFRSLILLGIILLEIALTGLIPAWRESFYTVLQAKDVAGFYPAIVAALALFLGLGVAQGLKEWLTQNVSYRIRVSWFTRLYRLWTGSKVLDDNYVAPMSEALRVATEQFLGVLVEIVISLGIVVMLIITALHSPIILLSALVYSLAASALAYFFNSTLTNTSKERQLREGALVEGLGSRFREKVKDETIFSYLTYLSTAYFNASRVLMFFTLFSRTKSSLASLVPYLLMSGAYFSGSITLGVFMASVATFELIVVNATILIVLYPKVMAAYASLLITKEFEERVSK